MHMESDKCRSKALTIAAAFQGTCNIYFQ